jgi:uncharacterized membrane protein YeaQ/YmgE (transglycosylase-associated protein family)
MILAEMIPRLDAGSAVQEAGSHRFSGDTIVVTDPGAHAVGFDGVSIRRLEVGMGIIAWIVLGAIAGFITNLIMGGREGVIGTIILGIIGAVVGGYIAGSVLKVADVTGINVESIVVSVIGAILVVAVYRAVTGRRRAI